MATGNSSFDTLATTTLQNYTEKLEDIISSRVTVYHFLKSAGRVREKDGGRTIVEPLMYGKNSTSKTYGLYEPLDITPQSGMTAAEFTPKQHAVTVAIAGLEEAMNKGDAEVVDLLESKIQQAEITASEDFEVMFQGDGTGNSGKNFLGIDALIGDQSSTVTTVGGIDATDAGNTWWRSSIDRNGGTDTVLKLTDMSRIYNNATRGQAKPNWGQTTQALFEKYEALLQPAQRFTDSKTAEAGFHNLTFKGIPLVWGDAVKAKSVTFVNSDYLRLNKWGKWLSPTPFMRPENQDARYSQIISYGNLSVSNRKLAGSRLENRIP